MMPEHSPARSSSDAASRVTAIETSYKGYRFRSRLEARWAVFFDHLKLEWKYEPQGYRIGAGGGVLYLPDFWLPGPGLWVEVKGSVDRQALATIGMAAEANHGLPITPEHDVRPPEVAGWPSLTFIDRVLVLGDIPDPHAPWAHPVVCAVPNGFLRVFRLFMSGGSRGHFSIIAGQFANTMMPTEPDDAGFWPHGLRDNRVALHPIVTSARTAARSARFEHGESGAF